MSVMAATRPLPGQTLARLREQTSLTDRAGRRFAPRAEKDLDPALRDLAARLPGAARGVAVIAEMPGPTGLPDLVAVPLTVALADRLDHGSAPLLAWLDARLVAAVSVHRPLTVAAVARRLGVRERSVVRNVSRLVHDGALRRTETGCLLRAPAMRPVGTLYALEAKVDNWSAGLDQALRYSSWADASAVVVARLPQDPTRAVTLARDLQLGLALGTRWLVRPTVRRLEFARRLWASEHVVAALGGAHRTPARHDAAHQSPSALA